MRRREQAIRRFVNDNFLFGRDDMDLRSHDSFLARKVIDTAGVIELVLFLERQYHIKVHENEVIPDNLDSIDQVVKFVERKLGDRAHGIVGKKESS